jgi:hypothetical protein
MQVLSAAATQDEQTDRDHETDPVHRSAVVNRRRSPLE